MGILRLRESQIEGKVCDYAKKRGWLCYKFVSPARRSVPDRMFVKRRRVFFIEFKARGKRPTAGQWREIKRLRDEDIPVWVCDDVGHGKKMIDTEDRIVANQS